MNAPDPSVLHDTLPLVLVVDDEARSLDAIRRNLEEEFRVLTAASADEARGLLGRVARAGTYRQYGEDDVARVQLIRQALALGFRLAELDGLHALPSPQGWQQVAALVAARRAAVARERERLRRLDRQLAALEAELRSCDVANAPRLVLDCPAAGLGAA